jgi:hypothetical protein
MNPESCFLSKTLFRDSCKLGNFLFLYNNLFIRSKESSFSILEVGEDINTGIINTIITSESIAVDLGFTNYLIIFGSSWFLENSVLIRILVLIVSWFFVF